MHSLIYVDTPSTVSVMCIIVATCPVVSLPPLPSPHSLHTCGGCSRNTRACVLSTLSLYVLVGLSLNPLKKPSRYFFQPACTHSSFSTHTHTLSLSTATYIRCCLLSGQPTCPPSYTLTLYVTSLLTLKNMLSVCNSSAGVYVYVRTCA
jgi:hypothetical protein